MTRLHYSGRISVQAGEAIVHPRAGGPRRFGGDFVEAQGQSPSDCHSLLHWIQPRGAEIFRNGIEYRTHW